jgi:arylsulfatase A-like enzyme
MASSDRQHRCRRHAVRAGRSGAFGLLCVLVALVAGCDSAPRPVGRDHRFNVLVILVDTLGAQHVGAFMNPSMNHTPQMDALAARGVVFRRAYATSPWTQPSVASVFTGALPSRHGMRAIGDPIRPDVETLAERLGARGFRTGALVSNFLLRPEFGLERGFSSYQSPGYLGPKTITSDDVTSRAIAWLDDHVDSRFFLFVHYFDPHYSYRHHPRFDRTSDYAGDLTPDMDIWELRRRRRDLTPEDIDYLVGLHHEEIAFTDSQIGRLLDHLEALGKSTDTLVVLTADHGEEFMRHGWIGHTRTLYEELLHVPMIVAWPGVIEPGEITAPVSLVDIMPTILELDGDPVRRPVWEGRSLVPLLSGGDPLAPTRRIFAEVSFLAGLEDPQRREKIAFKTSLVWRRHKVIHDLLSDAWELYDLEDDPEELRNLIDQHPERAELVGALDVWEADHLGAATNDSDRIDEDSIEKLRSLGYLE